MGRGMMSRGFTQSGLEGSILPKLPVMDASPSEEPTTTPTVTPERPDIEVEPNTVPVREPVEEPEGEPCQRPGTSCPVRR